MRGLIYDGLSARGQAAAVTIELGILVISYADGSIERISLSTLARGTRSPERITVHRDDAPDWRELAQRKLVELDEQIARAEAARAAISHGLRCPRRDPRQRPDFHAICPDFQARVTSRPAGRPA